MRELTRLATVKKISKLLPFRHRLTKMLYNYQNVRGIDIVKNPYTKYNLKFLLNTKDYIGWNIFFFDEYEKETNKIIEEYVYEGSIVIEAGANHGSETVIISHLVGDTGHNYAFEPVPKIYNQLRNNIIINDFEHNTTIEKIALGAKEDEIEFYLVDENEPNQGMGSMYSFGAAGNKIQVKQMTLDDYVASKQIKKIDFVKMDIQGAEYDMLVGSKVVLEKWKPVLYFEADDVQSGNAGTELQRLYDLVSQYDYQIFLVNSSGNKESIEKNNLKAGNWLAIPIKK